jgi:CheY-like chemotaxis protein
VAEDKIMNQKVVLYQLEMLGYAADAVTNGRDLLEALESTDYDIILMDCQMPEMDGYEASAEIRRREGSSRHSIIIAMTAHVLEGDREKCLAAGMDDYISKPVKLEALKSALDRWSVDPIQQQATASNIHAHVSVEDNLESAILATFGAIENEGQRDVVTQLLDLVLRDAPPTLATLREALAKGDMETFAHAAHDLKGSCGIFGLHQIAALSAELEQRGSTRERAEDLLAELENELERLGRVFESERSRTAL